MRAGAVQDAVRVDEVYSYNSCRLEIDSERYACKKIRKMESRVVSKGAKDKEAMVRLERWAGLAHDAKSRGVPREVEQLINNNRSQSDRLERDNTHFNARTWTWTRDSLVRRQNRSGKVRMQLLFARDRSCT